MHFVIPCSNAGQLGLNRHRAAVVGAVKQEAFENVGVAGDKTRTQAWQVRTLGQAVEHHAALEVLAAQFCAGAEQAWRRRLFVEVEFAVALVRGNHEVMLIGQGDQLFQGLDRNQCAGRVAWRAQEQDLAAFPDVRRHGVEIRVEAVFVQAWQVMRLGPGEERRAFVDLVERVRADHQRVIATVDYGLGEGEQRLAGAVDRQHVARRIDPAFGDIEATFAPGGDGFAQGRDAEGGRVYGHLIEIAGQRFGDEAWRAVFRLANGQCNRAFVRVGRDAAEQGTEFFERVGLELGQSVVHR
ncbi:hypothetical protein D3C86_1471660 [compost metagenome]